MYQREAHPLDGWRMPGCSTLHDPRSQEERSRVAAASMQTLRFAFTTVVDTMDDRTAARWAGWPDRIYVVDREGKIVYAGKQGPGGFWPTEASRLRRGPRDQEGESLEAFLKRTLLAGSSRNPSTRGQSLNRE